ncbi:MAG: hypothetical protein ACAI25_11265 [Planctomycetota bacterium]
MRYPRTKPLLLAFVPLAIGPLFYFATTGTNDVVERVEYQFGRPVRKDERTYAWYRQTHAEANAARLGVTAEAIGDGMDTWHWWCGVDNPGFWRDLACLTGGKQVNASMAKVDFLRMLAELPRAKRFDTLGLMNDPDCVAADEPDRYGLTLDRMKEGALTRDPEVFGYSSGVIGLQLFANKKFDPKKWSAKKYFENAASVEPPYLVGMSCAFCHVSFDPRNPPADPNEPGWENLDSAIGNQYLREGLVFGYGLPRTSFTYQYLDHQPPGTSETSRFPSDFINNPVRVSSIHRLRERLKLAKSVKPVQDPSGGLPMASTRVYVNEGMAHDIWTPTWALNAFDPASSARRNFETPELDLVGTARKDPKGPWMQTEARMPNMATFLASWDGDPLEEAREVERPGMTPKHGRDYLSPDTDLVQRGKIAFAESCARCHSSKQPQSLPRDPEGQRKAWRSLVLRDDFLKDNYLSDDDWHPCSELGTNVSRAMSTDWLAGHTLGQVSSETYKEQRATVEPIQDQDVSGKPVPLYNPVTAKRDLAWKSSRVSYRTPSLVGIWATAPYLHNNSVGLYSGDYTVAGRIEAYNDGMKKLLWPVKRPGVKSVKVTTEDARLPDVFPVLLKFLPELADLPGLDLDLIRIPKGTPINLIMNIHPRDMKSVIQAYVDGVLQDEPRTRFAELRIQNHDAGMQRMLARMLEVNLCPDFVEDRGHTYGRELSESDKWALIEYMKRF